MAKSLVSFFDSRCTKAIDVVTYPAARKVYGTRYMNLLDPVNNRRLRNVPLPYNTSS